MTEIIYHAASRVVNNHSAHDSDTVNNTITEEYNRQSKALFADLFMSVHSDVVDVPLLVLGRIIDRLVFALVVRYVKFVSVKRPRDEHHFALLVVEWKVLHVQRAVRLDDGGKHPQNLSARRDNGERVHEVLVQRAVRLDDGGKHPQNLSARRDNGERVHEVLEAVISAGTPHHVHQPLSDIVSEFLASTVIRRRKPVHGKLYCVRIYDFHRT